MVLKAGVSVENDNLKVSSEVPQPFNRSRSKPKMSGVRIVTTDTQLLQILPRHYSILLIRNAIVFEKVSKHTLKGYYKNRPLHLCHSPSKKVSKCSFECFIG